MLRALFLNRDLEYHGGVSNVLLTLARGNVPPRAELRFGSLMPPSEAIRAAFGELGLNLYRIGDRGYLAPALALRRILKRDRIDVVVASSFKAALVAKMAATGLGCRVVHYIHAIDLVLDGRFKKRIFRLISRHDAMLFVSRAVEQAHRPPGHKGLSAVVYNGVRDPYDDPTTHPYPRSFRA